MKKFFRVKKIFNSKSVTFFNNRGALIDKGSIYVVVILTMLIFGAYIFVGGTLPAKLPKPSAELVSVIIPANFPTGLGLQMHTLVGATLTPAPTLASPPTLGPNQPKLVECNRQVTGKQAPEILWAFTFDTTPAGGNEQALKVFYTSKNALTLGSGAVSQMKKTPADDIVNPSIGNPAARDIDNLPIYPALFITDNTTDPNAVSGDAQVGGQPNKPDIVYGTWKPSGASDPPANDLQLGPLADAWPAANGPGGPHDTTFTSEIVWKIPTLIARNPVSNQFVQLIPGNKYRVQIIVHEGSNPSKVALACLQFNLPRKQKPPPPPPPPPQPQPII